MDATEAPLSDSRDMTHRDAPSDLFQGLALAVMLSAVLWVSLLAAVQLVS
jgi:hypothetical protein